MVSEYIRVRLKLVEELARTECDFAHKKGKSGSKKAYVKSRSAFTKLRLWDAIHDKIVLPTDELLECQRYYTNVYRQEDMKWEKVKEFTKKSGGN